MLWKFSGKNSKSLLSSHFHFVGVGGIGMCGLAELLFTMGSKVSGSDMSENANTERLKKLGIPIFKGHDKENVQDADVVVYSSAVPKNNPEIQQAIQLRIPLIQRAEALAEIMRLKRGLAVAGSHGKTTTTSMVGSLFYHSDLQPTIVVGGRFDLIGSTAKLGTGDWLIAEADESDGSFQKLHPEISIITNIDTDHLDHYKTIENLHKAFYQFAMHTPFYGLVLACGDDPEIRKTFANFPKRILFYGFDSSNDFVLSGEKGSYFLKGSDGRLTGTAFEALREGFSFTLPTPGKHNALNATAAVLTAHFAGISLEKCQKALNQFGGVDRRFHFKGEARGIKIYDDYGHHPTEIKATLQAFKEKYPQNRLVIYFQPHRYSRTQLCWSEFADSFKDSDVLFLADIYAAGEKPIEGITSQKLLETIPHTQKSLYATGSHIEKISSQLRDGDVFVTLGAGDGWKLGLAILDSLK